MKFHEMQSEIGHVFGIIPDKIKLFANKITLPNGSILKIRTKSYKLPKFYPSKISKFWFPEVRYSLHFIEWFCMLLLYD